ncbi:Cyclin-dependent kinase 10 [Dissophora globulifera]|uniref:cyclin-dependent kinase n=1 Tax=Dissophora globulifera TaxID=979702 RepID=A0A9P6RM21_9FUNG|nr:Cyclin-dependent kinase 10 [Dissophora globulifera]
MVDSRSNRDLEMRDGNNRESRDQLRSASRSQQRRDNNHHNNTNNRQQPHQQRERDNKDGKSRDAHHKQSSQSQQQPQQQKDNNPQANAGGSSGVTEGARPDPLSLLSITGRMGSLTPDKPFFGNSRIVDDFEKLNKVGEGTYGVVYRAKDKKTNEIVALKRIRMERENDGLPISSLREIKLLKTLRHDNIVLVKDVAVGSDLDQIFLVMEYCEQDMAALMDNVKKPYTPAEVKCLMYQLFKGIEYCHDHYVIHRDLKLSNLLLNSQGILKIAPELLFGDPNYTTAVDMWSAGCIFGELLQHAPLLPGKVEKQQVDFIIELLGTPHEKIWQGFNKLPMSSIKLPEQRFNNLRNKFPNITDAARSLLSGLLTYDPKKRLSVKQALAHPYFIEAPPAKHPSLLPTHPEVRNIISKRPEENAKLKRQAIGDETESIGNNRKRRQVIHMSTLRISSISMVGQRPFHAATAASYATRSNLDRNALQSQLEKSAAYAGRKRKSEQVAVLLPIYTVSARSFPPPSARRSSTRSISNSYRSSGSINGRSVRLSSDQVRSLLANESFSYPYPSANPGFPDFQKCKNPKQLEKSITSYLKSHSRPTDHALVAMLTSCSDLMRSTVSSASTTASADTSVAEPSIQNKKRPRKQHVSPDIIRNPREIQTNLLQMILESSTFTSEEVLSVACSIYYDVSSGSTIMKQEQKQENEASNSTPWSTSTPDDGFYHTRSPSIIVTNAFLQVCSMSGHFDKAWSVMEGMMHRSQGDVKPDVATYQWVLKTASVRRRQLLHHRQRGQKSDQSMELSEIDARVAQILDFATEALARKSRVALSIKLGLGGLVSATVGKFTMLAVMALPSSNPFGSGDDGRDQWTFLDPSQPVGGIIHLLASQEIAMGVEQSA